MFIYVCKPADFEILENLQLTIYGSTPSRSKSKNKFHWILTENDIPIGFCSLTIRFKEETAWLGGCGILKEYRGKEYQTFMIKHREKFLRRKQVKKVITSAMKNNTPSIKNLEKCGFVINDETLYSYNFRKYLY